MQTRINLQQLEPDAYKAMYGLEKYLSKAGLDSGIKHLVKIRASQINGCAFCIDMHTREARATGETEQRIYLLNAWRETDLFTPKEKALLALTESVTHISNHVSDDVFATAASFCEPNELAQWIMAIISINSWNRIAISTRLPVPGE
ncbi:carboxymuconolactone decarboxylase family protein [Flavihumibacter petaseus]|uniref:Carboxymuconolactone decarboxylase-like domain-containing protein n=1 Tax=Flavihumibacter petaseus NBRC 106054 TaxID=1220578 RepID=A0A0E9N6G1_9BACT|nr:carboxymuconolactone decarboxylase family protein [Flavihumibacter petaseus]GAO44930.1 hypothetical protein FPE01S_04_01730 [Flavihumibacter petaseus NBRC 106054]